jgi:hypothetical protein
LTGLGKELVQPDGQSSDEPEPEEPDPDEPEPEESEPDESPPPPGPELPPWSSVEVAPPWSSTAVLVPPLVFVVCERSCFVSRFLGCVFGLGLGWAMVSAAAGSAIGAAEIAPAEER